MTSTNYGKVAVMMGGESNERDISLLSGQAVLSALLNAGVDAHAFDPSEQALSDLQKHGFDRVFNALHGKVGEDGVLQGSLAMMKVPCTGSNMLASAIGMDKVRSKLIWKALQLDVIPGHVIQEDDEFSESDAEKVYADYGPKLMVKPASEGSSLGMSICTTVDELLTAIEVAKEFSKRVLIEGWMSGPEYTVAILGNHCLPSIRIVPHRDFYDFEAKYETDSGTEYFCPSGLTESQEEKLQTIALKAFMAVGCSGWGRVDFMYDKQSENMYLMEINTVPGMTETSLVPKAAAAEGMSFEALCLAILDSSLTE